MGFNPNTRLRKPKIVWGGLGRLCGCADRPPGGDAVKHCARCGMAFCSFCDHYKLDCDRAVKRIRKERKAKVANG